MIENKKISKNRLESINSFYRITGQNALKDNRISELLKWKEEYLDKFEHNIGRKITFKSNNIAQYALDFYLFSIWYGYQTGRKRRRDKLMKFYEQSENKKSKKTINYKKYYTKQYLRWERQMLDIFIKDNILIYEKDFFKTFTGDLFRISKSNVKKMSHFEDWKIVLWKYYINSFKFDDFKNWYELKIKKRIYFNIIPTEHLIEIQPRRLDISIKVHEALATIGKFGEHLFFSKILPKELLKRYPEAHIERNKNKILIKKDNIIQAEAIWNNMEKESGKSYDFEIKDREFSQYIEVKSSTTNEINFTITYEELNFAKSKGSNYILYYIKNLGSGNEEWKEFPNFYSLYKNKLFHKKAISLKR